MRSAVLGLDLWVDSRWLLRMRDAVTGENLRSAVESEASRYTVVTRSEQEAHIRHELEARVAELEARLQSPRSIE